VYGEDVVNERTYRKWFVKFRRKFWSRQCIGIKMTSRGGRQYNSDIN